jgi:8-oxo-dGTP pyrophosphatase MutT (NUDIX family)
VSAPPPSVGAGCDFLPIEFVVRASAHLLPQPQPQALDPGFLPERGDDQINEAAPTAIEAALARPAAVLVPALARPEGVTLLLTQRASHLRDHSGQIAFPGGKIDPSDGTPLAAAVREAREEIGLSSRHVRPLGYLETYLTGTGYRIVPVVALIDPAAALRLDHREVEAIFEVPLGFLMDPSNHQLHTRMFRGRPRRYYAMPYGERYIWGVTAGIIRNLYERLYS